MLITKLGEFGLIERIKKAVHTDSSVVKGIGDDCAVLRYSDKLYQLVTCDMVIEGVDFLPSDDPYLIGRKALAISLSDIAACAGIPRHCLVSFACPGDTSVAFADKIFSGIRGLANKFGVNIVGGDISRSRRLTIDVTVLGEVEKKRLVLRSGAREKDIIFVTGRLGGSIKGKHLKFTPRLAEARFLTGNFKVNAMIDISDGLAQDLGHILKESKKGARIYEDLIPVSPQAKGIKDVLFSGEDFELLFTLPLSEARRLLRREMRVFQPIGEVMPFAYGLKLVDEKAKENKVSPKGYRHF